MTVKVIQSTMCYHSHAPLILGIHQIVGGSCIHPITQDSDIYIGLDGGMKHHQKSLPWMGDVLSIPYPIPDMGVPSNAKSFIKMIDWIAAALGKGKSIHVGCIGGHGRTGLVLSALTNVVLGELDAITYVRNNYCKKAVESSTQVEYLHKHFGIHKVEGAKTYNISKNYGLFTANAKYNSTPSNSVGKGTLNKADKYTVDFLEINNPIW